MSDLLDGNGAGAVLSGAPRKRGNMTTKRRPINDAGKPSRVNRGAVVGRAFLRLGDGPVSRYQRYLRSEHWQETRERVARRSGGVCETPDCSNAARQVHHIRYDYIGGEYLDDLVHLCGPCHRKQHPEKCAGKWKTPKVECPVCGRKQRGHGGLQSHIRSRHYSRYFEFYGESVGVSKVRSR